MGAAQGAQQGRGRRLCRVAPARYDDDVGGGQRAQAVGYLYRKAGGGAQGAGLAGADAKVKTRGARVFVPKHHAGHGKMKRADAVEGDGRDPQRCRACGGVDGDRPGRYP